MTSPRKRLDEEPDDHSEDYIPYREDRGIRQPRREFAPRPTPPATNGPSPTDVADEFTRRLASAGLVQPPPVELPRIITAGAIDRMSALERLSGLLREAMNAHRGQSMRPITALVGEIAVSQVVIGIEGFQWGMVRRNIRLFDRMSGRFGRMGGFFLLVDVVFPSQAIREAVIQHGLILQFHHNRTQRRVDYVGPSAIHEGAVSTFIIGTPSASMHLYEDDSVQVDISNAQALEGHRLFVVLSGVTQLDI